MQLEKKSIIFMNLSCIVDYFYSHIASVYYMDIFIYGYSYLY